jgi:hypothetical protein
LKRRSKQPRPNIIRDAIAVYDKNISSFYDAAEKCVMAEAWRTGAILTPSEKTELTRLFAEDMLDKWRRSQGPSADAIPIGGTFLMNGNMEGAIV